MLRSFVPFLLALLGFVLFGVVINMPLLEWRVSEIVTVPPYDVQFHPSPWIAKFGDALDDSSYIAYQFDVSYCGNNSNLEKMTSVVKRSPSEATLEQFTRVISFSFVPWLLLLLGVCGIYVWWYALQSQRPIAGAVGFMIAIAILFCVLLDVERTLFSSVFSLGCVEGTVLFNAELSKIHYETLLALLVASIAEVGAIGVMLRQFIRAIMQRKESAKLGVG